jgi:regulator of protease activity HflC (stomatin/prohibitin superfamily)
MRRPQWSNHLGGRDAQGCFGLLRVALFFLILAFFGYYSSTRINHLDTAELLDLYRKTYPVAFAWWPEGILIRFARVLNPSSVKYMIMPFTAFIFVMYASANFVRDVYALPNINLGFRYVFSSMFALWYPRIIIDKGKEPKVDPYHPHLLQKIGGPGYAIVEPGSVAVFRHLRELAEPAIATTHFMAPFETIALTVDLAEQQNDIEEPIRVTTRDGIIVNLRDVHYRYRIRQQRNGQPARRTIENPFPFEDEVLRNMILSLFVEKNGGSSWNASVERPITGEITDFIAAHSIDYLTAPRQGTQHPRQVLNERMYTVVNSRLANSGAELLWVDVGHIDIEDGRVDEQRGELWASDWIGESKVQMAISDAVRQSYAELGRAQAQAEIIMSIAEALHSANLQEQPAISVRQLLLARTAQLLEAIGNNQKK